MRPFETRMSWRAALLPMVVSASSSSLKVTGWISGLPTTATEAGYTMPLTMDGAISGWVGNLMDPTAPLRLDFKIGGKPVGSANATGLFFNDKPVIPQAPPLLHLNWIFHVPTSLLTANKNASLSMVAVDPTSGLSAPFEPGAAGQAGTLTVALRPVLSRDFHPALGSGCLGAARCLSNGDGLSFGAPWFDVPRGWAQPSGDLFQEWNCSAPEGGVDTIVQLSILPYARRAHSPLTTPGDRYHHRGFKKDSLHLAESESSPDGGPVIHFSAAREGIPGSPGRALGEGGRVSSNWALKKAMYNKTTDRWEIFDQLDAPSDGYGVSSYDGVDGVNMIMNHPAAVGWGPTATVSPMDPRCRIPALSNVSVSTEIPSFPLVGTGPLGLTTIQEYLYNGSNLPAEAEPVRRCIHMNPKLAEFGDDGTPHVMWAYLWTIEPAHGCYLPDGRFLPAGYYPYRLGSDPTRGWQLALGDGPGQGKAEVNQTRGQAMKKVWGINHQTEFIYSCWDLPPQDRPPSSVLMVDTSSPTPRVGTPLLQCYGTPDGNKVHLGEATGNKTDLYFLADFDRQVAASDQIGEVFSADIFYAYRSGKDERGHTPQRPEWAIPTQD